MLGIVLSVVRAMLGIETHAFPIGRRKGESQHARGALPGISPFPIVFTQSEKVNTIEDLKFQNF